MISRLGVQRRVDILLGKTDNLTSAVEAHLLARANNLPPVRCLLIDEAQFMTPEQVDQALEVALFKGIPIIAYGLRTDFKTQSFPGSRRLMEVAHTLE